MAEAFFDILALQGLWLSVFTISPPVKLRMSFKSPSIETETRRAVINTATKRARINITIKEC